ncbi:MAG: U32 family peptidase [Lachnospiraceae bacterium]|nr:U32 family peptidase [Lachnospiraceae bacterium]
MKKVELLAPVKDEECLKAVIESGADSVYMGYQQFNARMFGKNFDESQFRKSIKYAHKNGVKVYLTLNTLIWEKEIRVAVQMAVQAVKDRVDGILVQDLGLVSAIREKIPDISLHASTQMSVANHYGVQELCSMGFSRVVMARELNLQEIALVKRACLVIPEMSSMEIEAFIHGGLCIAYSGQCFSSSCCCGSSANRGRCLMPCWKGYALTLNGKILESGSLLRPRDLEGLQGLKYLMKEQIDCFKIQGRLRDKSYISKVVDVYRQEIANIVEHRDNLDREKMYNRQLWKISPRGLTGGNLLPKSGKNLIMDTDVEIVIPKESNIVKRKILGRPIKQKIAIYLKEIALEENYSLLRSDIEWVYIPFESFREDHFRDIIQKLCKRYGVYIYMPPMVYERNCEIVYNEVDRILNRYAIQGIVLSNVSDLMLLKRYGIEHLEYVSGNHLHIANHFTSDKLKEMGIKTGTFSLEVPFDHCVILKRNTRLSMQQIIFGHPDLMHMKYCLLSHSNECIHCGRCSEKEYRNLELIGDVEFDIRIQKFQTETILYSKKIVSLDTNHVIGDSVRFDFLEESIAEMNQIIEDARDGYFYVGNGYINEILKGD